MCALRGQQIAFLRFLLHNNNNSNNNNNNIIIIIITININNNNKQLCKDLPSTNKDQEESESSWRGLVGAYLWSALFR